MFKLYLSCYDTLKQNSNDYPTFSGTRNSKALARMLYHETECRKFKMAAVKLKATIFQLQDKKQLNSNGYPMFSGSTNSMYAHCNRRYGIVVGSSLLSCVEIYIFPSCELWSEYFENVESLFPSFEWHFGQKFWNVGVKCKVTMAYAAASYTTVAYTSGSDYIGGNLRIRLTYAVL